MGFLDKVGNALTAKRGDAPTIPTTLTTVPSENHDDAVYRRIGEGGERDQLKAPGVVLGTDLSTPKTILRRATTEEAALVVGPPRCGKTSGLFIPTVALWDGPVVCTSTKGEIWEATAVQRANRENYSVVANHAIWLWDPTNSVEDSFAEGTRFQRLRWDFLEGCEEPRTCMRRAGSLVGALDDEGRDGHWRDRATSLLQCYIHAARTGRGTIADVLRWLNAYEFSEPIQLLETSAAAPSWAADLRAFQSVPEKERGSIFSTALRTLRLLADPDVLKNCQRPPEDDVWPFSIEGFLSSQQTVYIAGPSEDQNAIAPLIVAFVEALSNAARRRAQKSPTGRLDPALLLCLDEAANIAPLPSLPSLVSEGGGQGIITMVGLQSLAQARARWGSDKADALIQACTSKVFFGGITSREDLEFLAMLCGEVDVAVTSYTSGTSDSKGTSSSGDTNGTSNQTTRTQSTTRSIEHRQRITPDLIRQIPRSTALLVYRNTHPTFVGVPHWSEYLHRIAFAPGLTQLGPEDWQVERRSWEAVTKRLRLIQALETCDPANEEQVGIASRDLVKDVYPPANGEDYTDDSAVMGEVTSDLLRAATMVLQSGDQSVRACLLAALPNGVFEDGDFTDAHVATLCAYLRKHLDIGLASGVLHDRLVVGSSADGPLFRLWLCLLAGGARWDDAGLIRPDFLPADEKAAIGADA